MSEENASQPQPADLSRQSLLKFMGTSTYEPMKRAQLMDAFSIPKDDRGILNALLRDLTDDGFICKLPKLGYALADRGDLAEGSLAFTRGGSAFLTVDADGSSIFIAARNTGTALPGDRVLVRIRSSRGHSQAGKLAEGKVLRVIERRTKTLVGTLKRQHRLWYVEPMQATVTRDVVVPSPEGAQLGDRVLVQLSAWDDPNLAPEGEIVEVIGPADDPSLDTLAVMRNYSLDPAFPADVIAEAETCTLSDADYADRLDLRTTFTFTIDPATARDFDDAISLEKRGKDWLLGVHIADVSHYVRPGTALDKEAQRRATSVYLTDQVVPMLPEQLSNGLCSLKPRVDRLAFSALITLDVHGRVKNTRFARTVINSDVRLSYEEAMEIISGTQKAYPKFELPPPRTSRIRDAHKLAQRLRSHRLKEEGAFNMNLPEVRFVIGKDGRIADIVGVVNDESHQLIEEFMLLTNELVARELSTRTVPHVHRIHDAPDPERLGELAEQFVASGISVGNLTNRRAIVELLERIADMPQCHAWNTAILRSMRKAEYSTKPIGHYGLNKQFYDHFTSPIRRYPDLIDHRILGALISGKNSPYQISNLDELCRHCSECERTAMEAERELTGLKRLRYFSEQIESKNLQTYDAIITEVRNFGLFINIPQVQTIGLIPVSLLSDDYYRFDQSRLELRGSSSGTSYRVGTQLAVQVARVDFEKKFLDFQPVAEPNERKKRSHRGKRPARKGDKTFNKKNRKRKK